MFEVLDADPQAIGKLRFEATLELFSDWHDGPAGVTRYISPEFDVIELRGDEPGVESADDVVVLGDSHEADTDESDVGLEGVGWCSMFLCSKSCCCNVHEDILVNGTTAALLFAARMGPSAVSWSGGSAPANREDTVAIIAAGGLRSSITMQWPLLRPSEMLSTVSAGEVRPFVSKSASSLLSSSSLGIPWLS